MSSNFESAIIRDSHEKEFHQAVTEVLQSVAPLLERDPQYRSAKIIQRIVEPERVIMFRVPWVDDHPAHGRWQGRFGL